MRCRPTDDEIYYKRGEAYEQDGDLLLAMEDYSKVSVTICKFLRI